MQRLVGILAVTMALLGCVSCSSYRLTGKEESSERKTLFAGRKSVSNVRTTAYSDKENEKGGIYKNLSAKGTPLKFGRLRSAAADWSHMPMGTLFRIKGLPYIYEVDDYGSALVGTETIDLYKPDLRTMNAWGTRHVDIEVIREGSYAESLEILNGRLSKAAHVREMASRIKREKM